MRARDAGLLLLVVPSAAACAAVGGEPAWAPGPRDDAGGLDGAGGWPDAGAGGGGDGGKDGSGGKDGGGGSHDVFVPDADGPDGGNVPDAANLPPMKTQAFLIGYNEAWFGMSFGTDYTTSWDLAYVQKTFDGIVVAGGHLVRLFLWEVPQGITLGASAPQTQGVSAELLTNIDTTLTEARKRGLWVYVTLLDGNTIAKITGSLHTYGVNLLNNTAGEQDAFNDKALRPLLQVLGGHKDNVFAIDIINEIQAAYKNGVFADSKNGPRAFLLREALFIKSNSPWVKVTASAGWPDDFLKTGAQYDIANGFYSGLGLDFYDLHVYSDSGTFPGATAMCSRAAADGVPVYLGEFGQKSHSVDDTLQYKATASFLNGAMGLCFRGAFAWRYDAAEAWWAYVRADGSLRPAASIMQTFGALP
jgi:hypothetical protein